MCKIKIESAVMLSTPIYSISLELSCSATLNTVSHPGHRKSAAASLAFGGAVTRSVRRQLGHVAPYWTAGGATAPPSAVPLCAGACCATAPLPPPPPPPPPSRPSRPSRPQKARTSNVAQYGGRQSVSSSCCSSAQRVCTTSGLSASTPTRRFSASSRLRHSCSCSAPRWSKAEKSARR